MKKSVKYLGSEVDRNARGLRPTLAFNASDARAGLFSNVQNISLERHCYSKLFSAPI
jgi:hypothetical protein